MSAEAEYLVDLGRLLREQALEAKSRAATASADEKEFQSGRALAYYEVLSLLQQQAETAFHLPLAKLGLEGFDADRDLLSR